LYPTNAKSLFIEGIVQESSVYQHILETVKKETDQQLIQQGARQIAIRSLFAVLEFRFDGRAVQALRPALENIKDLQQLQELHNEALRAENFEAFTHILGMNGNEE
jgi:hypothetical protein